MHLSITHPNPSASIRLRPLSTTIEVVKTLPDEGAELFAALCFYFDPADPYTILPTPLQQEIDQRLWCAAIAQLQVRGLVEVAIGGCS